MKTVNAKGIVKIPEGVEVTVKSRNVVVKGKRGTLTKSFRHMSVDLYKPDENTVKVEKWFAKSKELSVIKTCCSHIQNMIDGVTKGFQYRMKMVYAHFPTNVQIATNGQSLDIVNFIGQKVKFHVDCLDGVKVERDTQVNTEILIHGNDIENVSKTCALISQSCAIKNKDIRKFLDGIYVSNKTFKDE
jgi:large subunit ribosomal protein L9e